MSLNETKELEPLIIESLDSIETGLTYCGNQINLGDYGRLDILAKGKNGDFVIIELKTESVDSAIVFQSLKYHRAISTKIDDFKRVYNVDGSPEIRIVCIATHFKPDVFDIYENYDFKVNMKFIEYHETGDNEKILLDHINRYDRKVKTFNLYNREGIINGLKEDRLRTTFMKTLDFLNDKGFIEVCHTGNKVIDFYRCDEETGEKVMVYRFETVANFFKCWPCFGVDQEYKTFRSFGIWKNEMFARYFS